MVLGFWGFWVIIASLGCYAIYRLAFPLIIAFPAMIRFYNGGRYKRKNTLTEEQYKKLSVGSLIAYYQNAYINTLSTGLKKKGKAIIQDKWGVFNRDDAFNLLEDLCEQPYSDYFCCGQSEADKKTNEESEQDEFTVSACWHYGNLMDCYDELIQRKVIINKREMERYGATGWDAARLVFIARLCYDAKYISEEEAWEYIDIAYEMVKGRYNSWHEFAMSCIIGRAMFSGKGYNYGLVKLETDELLSSPEGPWTQFPL